MQKGNSTIPLTASNPSSNLGWPVFPSFIWPPLPHYPAYRHDFSLALVKCMRSLSTDNFNNTWRIMCESCGKLKPPHAFQEFLRDRVCNECSQPTPDVDNSMVEHVKGLFKKTAKTCLKMDRDCLSPLM